MSTPPDKIDQEDARLSALLAGIVGVSLVVILLYWPW